MIDYIRAKYEAPYQLRTELMDFITEVNTTTGETSGKMVGLYNQMKIIQYPSRSVYIEGSLHKFFNKADFNGNDFNSQDLSVTLYEIERVLGLTPQHLKLTNLEFGVNVTLPFDPQKVLNNLLFYQDKEFTKSITAGNFREVEKTQYFVKIYDKYRQYNGDDIEVTIVKNIQPNTFRFEMKYRKMQKLNDIGITYLTDLLDTEKMEQLKYRLLECFDEVYFYDFTMRTDKMNKREKEAIKDYCNPNFWSNIEDRVERFKNKRDYNKIVVKHSQNIKAKISNLIAEKWDELLRENCYKITNILEPNSDDKNIKHCYKITDISKSEIVTKLPLVYRVISLPFGGVGSDVKQGEKTEGKNGAIEYEKKERVCEVTKLDISMQKKGSKFLCFTGLKYYWKNEREIFNNLEKKYLPRNKRGVNLEDKIYFIAHNIRNAKFNKKHNRAKFEARHYPDWQMRLF
ncbi:hypothetical protein [Riemerella anatipestifer]|uniref:hypothetical protein n=1 Tax=Riemerella anatipestifer TaxID=34085 RepID=UPI0021F81B6C|nr:hypothetical protein [Riemerella anatipestifer]MCW0493303.1 hypothetical protein [Riemerella anatipestifer]MDR7750934.1 hypothetical protein [Riemerella anatipestifer]MDR7753069.1 hypothetical protein [Riemerella anatipestifer]MDR7755081.1 hypothetical protein [Riemerella anatipestifer]MDR7759217.1 hypothetical protein [Riemerella anatipestifer]